MKSYIVLDTEFNNKTNRITQLAAIKISNGVFIKSQFNRYIPSMDKEDQFKIWAGGNMRYSEYGKLPRPTQTVRDFIEWVGTTPGTPLVGWGVHGDSERVKGLFKMCSHTIPKGWHFLDAAKPICTACELDYTIPLQSAANFAGVPKNHAHNALDDCLRTFGLIKTLEQRMGKPVI